MKRMTVAVLVMTMIFTGVAWTQQDEHQEHHPAQQGDDAEAPGMMGGGMMQGGGMMMGMMNAPDVASWDGNVYMISGMKLEKLNSSMEVVETVEFEQMPGMMEGGMMQGGMMGGPMMQQGQQDDDTQQRPMMRHRQGDQDGGMMGGGMMQQGGMMGEGMMQRMHMMHRARAMSNSAITADAQGVYVLRGPTMTAYDHDLNELRSSDVMDMPEDAAMCPMCKKMMEKMQQDGGMMQGGGMMQDGGMMGGMRPGGMMMGQQWGETEERSVPGGMVHLSPPAQPRVGQIPFRVHVLGADQQTDTSASVSGFIYPQNQPERGKAVDFSAGPRGHMMGSVHLQTPGEYELAVRVNRPGQESTVVYYDVTVGQ